MNAMARDAVERSTLWTIRDGLRRETSDWVVVEEPLEIRIGGQSLAVVMRTPGHDVDLAAGFCLTEGIARSIADIDTIRQCLADGDPNQIDVLLAPGVTFDTERLRRNLMASAACGLCGKASIEALSTRAMPVSADPRVSRRVLESLPDRLLAAQESFGRTGALHASGLFGTDGSLRVCREDVGRHNAVDKVIGRSAFDGSRTDDAVLMVSGRTSFEILQKAAVAGIPIVCAISGPTTLAIETARAFRITLINFLRGSGMNVASFPERVVER